MSIGTAVVLLILIMAACMAARGSLKHFRGEGGCCGAPAEKIKKKKIKKTLEKKKIIISGMRCKNCEKIIENSLNAIDNVNAKASYSKGCAIVKLGGDVSDDALIGAVASRGYEAVSIQDCPLRGRGALCRRPI